MNQMEHNVKIKDYKKLEGLRPSLYYENILNRNQRFPDYQEQSKTVERFKLLHWQTDKFRLPHGDKLVALKTCRDIIMDNQDNERFNASQHRLAHLQGIKDNLEISHDRFFRRTELERPGAVEKQLGDKTLYKIINDGKAIKY